MGFLFGDAKLQPLASSHTFVHTSRWEGLPFTVLDALAAGLPVLMTYGTNLDQEVKGAGAGVIVSPDPGAIADLYRQVA